jgi:hypothetical protein
MFAAPEIAVARALGNAPTPLTPETREFVLRGFFDQLGHVVGERDPGNDAARLEMWERLTGMRWLDGSIACCDFLARMGAASGIGSVEDISRHERKAAEAAKKDDADDVPMVQACSLLAQARVPARHLDGEGDKFRGTTERGLVGRCKTPVVYLFGPRGSGKSYTAARRLLWVVRKRQGTVRWIDTVELANDLHPSFRTDDSERRIAEARQLGALADVLVLDDLGKSGRASADGIEGGALSGIVQELLEKRIRPGKVTIITSEYPLSGLGQRVPASVVARIEQSGTPVEFKAAKKA